MLPNAFIGKLKPPTTSELAAELGPAQSIWDKLLADLANEGVDLQEWNSYSPKAGWSLKVKRGKRTILYLAPCRSCFRVAFALGDRAVEAARQSKLPARAIRMLDEAKRYPEGTAVRIEVKKSGEIALVEQLARIKRDN